MQGTYLNISTRLYRCLLFAYPAHFRQRFGAEMLQTFRDCYRMEANKPRFWLRTFVDLVFTAAQERADGSGREGVLMNNTRKDLMAFLACVGIIVVALVLHRYGVRNQVPFILAFGYALDALIVTGVLGNLIFFVLAKTTKINRLRLALGTFGVVHAVLYLLGAVIALRVDPAFNLAGVTVGYVASFLFWTGLHWVWQRTESNSGQQPV